MKPNGPLMRMWSIVGMGVCLASTTFSARGQLPNVAMQGDAVPREVREIYERGLQFLVSTQTESGDWPGGHRGPGLTGMATMAFLASGEDPNFGQYVQPVRRALRSIVAAQDTKTGYLGDSMYQHGFAMLALAEAYGVVDERLVWTETAGKPNPSASLGRVLELAVRCAVTSQKKNALGAWRYSPDADDADTSVSGAVLVGLLAARNAGIEVPDAAINRAIAYYQSMTSASGQVAYAGFGGFDESIARSSIGNLVYAIARRKDLPQFQQTATYLKGHLEAESGQWRSYARYYQSQALFQSDMNAWEKWNKLLIRRLKEAQRDNGSIGGDFDPTVDTSLSLLSLALNYRFLPIYER